jgi:hypothetical protein
VSLALLAVDSSRGFFPIERTCPTCGGQGRVIRNSCRAPSSPKPSRGVPVNASSSSLTACTRRPERD